MVKNRLRIILAEKDIKVADLQKLTSLNKNTLYDIYHNEFRSISTEHMNKICNALEITPNDLFEYTPD